MDRKTLARAALFKAETIRRKFGILPTEVCSPFDIANMLGIDVYFLNATSLEGMYCSSLATICIGSLRPSGRQAFTCAHELGHHVFGHGARWDPISDKQYTDSEEFLADMFASYLLIPKIAFIHTLNDRNIKIGSISAEELYKISNYFGVGYASIVNHLAYNLKIISNEQTKQLLRVQPKHIKAKYSIASASTLYFADSYFYRPIDIEVDDMLLVPDSYEVETNTQLSFEGSVDLYHMYKAIASGYGRVIFGDWAAHIRVSRKNYEGLIDYRFMEE